MKWKPQARRRAQELHAELNRPNWDSYGARPIDAGSLERFEAILATLPDEARERLMVFPTSGGNLSIDTMRDEFMIDAEGAYAEVDGEEYEGPLAEMPREMLARFFVLEGGS